MPLLTRIGALLRSLFFEINNFSARVLLPPPKFCGQCIDVVIELLGEFFLGPTYLANDFIRHRLVLP